MLTTREAELRHSDMVKGQRWRGAQSRYWYVCKQHGRYKQTFSDHNSGHRCWRCGKKKLGLTIQQMESRCLDMEKGQLARGVAAKYKFICRLHGVYRQTFASHVRGCSCPQCGRAIVAAHKRLTIQEAESLFPDMVKGQMWRDVWSRYVFMCEKHGPYKQVYTNHYQGARCRECARTNRKIHGLSNSPEYRTVYGHWFYIFKSNKKNTHVYKGMPFCEAWNPDKGGSFLSGIRWIMDNLGPRPEGATMNVIKHEVGFVPGNLCWATAKQQVSNQMHKILGQQRHEIAKLKRQAPPMLFVDPKPLFAQNMLCPFGIAA